MTDESPSRIFIFETTHHAMWAEDVARDRAIPVELVPAPPDGGAKCGVALQTPTHRAGELTEALDSERILYRVLQG
jgi:hypothetical protein